MRTGWVELTTEYQKPPYEHNHEINSLPSMPLISSMSKIPFAKPGRAGMDTPQIYEQKK